MAQLASGRQLCASRSTASIKPSYSRSINVRSAQVIVCSYKEHSQGIASRVLPAIASGLLLLSNVAPVAAVGLESVDITPQLQSIQTPEGFKDGAKAEVKKLQAADEAFEKSDTLARLRAQSEANKEKNKKAIQAKYCYRQAELGVGDCGGLRYIPGMTESGKQRTPDWLSDLLGVERAPPEEEGKMTLRSLLGEDAAR